MRHRKKINHLGRKAEHRKATMSNMAVALIMNKRITTTVAKAKALRTYVEPLITRAKEDSTHNRRVAFSLLRNKYAVTELFREIGPKVADRPGGYTRILKLGYRKGDGAEMAMIELVDYNEVYTANPTASGTKKKRVRRGGKKKSEEQVAQENVETKVEEQTENTTAEEVDTKAEENTQNENNEETTEDKE